MDIIIVSAGKGTRLKSNMPKCLIEINNKSLLFWQIKNIHDVFPNAIIHVVLGYKSKKVINNLKNEMEGNVPNYVDFCINKKYETGSIIGSIRMAAKKCYNQNILRIDGDILFTKKSNILIPRSKNTVYLTESNIESKNLIPVYNEKSKKFPFIELIKGYIGTEVYMCVEWYFLDSLKEVLSCGKNISGKDGYCYSALNRWFRKSNKMGKIIATECIEIDTIEDLKIAKMLWKKWNE